MCVLFVWDTNHSQLWRGPELQFLSSQSKEEAAASFNLLPSLSPLLFLLPNRQMSYGEALILICISEASLSSKT